MFKVIGELINSTRKRVKEAVEARDADYIRDLATRQIEAGAYWVDVNGGGRAGQELTNMEWLMDVIQEVSGDTPLSLDSSDPAVLQMAYDKVKVRPLVNSISLEKARWENLAPFLKGKECDVMALCMDNTGLPKSLDDVLARTDKLVNGLHELGFENSTIYIDPTVQPISTDVNKGKLSMEAVRAIMNRYPGVHTSCGASNISFGLPNRRLVNHCFVPMMMSHGLDSAILDPLDQNLMNAIMIADMLMGNDRFCRNYLNAARSGKIVA